MTPSWEERSMTTLDAFLDCGSFYSKDQLCVILNYPDDLLKAILLLLH